MSSLLIVLSDDAMTIGADTRWEKKRGHHTQSKSIQYRYTYIEAMPYILFVHKQKYYDRHSLYYNTYNVYCV